MALQKQTISINFDKGLDTKSDGKLVLPGNLTKLENSVFDGANTISKRTGSARLGTNTIIGGGTISSGATALHAYQDELLEQVGSTLYSYTALGLASRSTINTASISKQTVVRNRLAQSGHDAASVGGFTMAAWVDTVGVYVSVTDDTTGTAYRYATNITTGAGYDQDPVCVAVGATTLCVLYSNANTLRLRYVSTTTPGTISSAVTIATNTADFSDARLDAVALANGTDILIAYRSNAGDTKVLTIDYLGTIARGPVNLAIAPNRALCVAEYGTGEFIVFCDDSVNGIRARLYNSALTALSAIFTVDATTTTVEHNMTFDQASETSAGSGTLIWDVAVSGTNRFLRSVDVTTAAGVGAISVLRRGVGLAGRSFFVSGTRYLPAVHESPLQATIFVLNANTSTAGVVAKLVYGTAGGQLPGRHAPGVWLRSGGDYVFAFGEKGRIGFIDYGYGGTTYETTPDGVSLAVLKFGQFLQSSELDETARFASGVPSMLDNTDTIVEEGFSLFPEAITVAVTVGGGSMSAGVYQFQACYEYVDGLGKLHRSAASPAVSATFALNDRASITVPTLRMTAKNHGVLSGVVASAVSIATYRTEVNGTISYRLSAGAVTNNMTADTVVITNDGTSDASLIVGEVLYTEGGVTENVAPPAARLTCAHQNRLVFAGLEDPLAWRYSSEVIGGEGLRFNEEYGGKLPPAGGDITALASFDDRLVFFKDSRIFVISGTGPNLLGQQNQYSEPQLLPSDVGCTEPRSVAMVPDGLMFMSARGIYLLDRGLQVSYIGAGVQTHNALTISGTVVLRNKSLVKFFTTGGTTLVYDYFYRQWSTATGQSAVGAVMFGNQPTYLTSAGNLYQSNTSFREDATDYNQTIETGWIAMAGVQGFQRIYRMLLEGQQKSPCTLTISVGYDYSASYSYSFTYAVAGGDIPLQIRHPLRTQKCEAVRFKIVESAPTTPWSGVSLTNLSLEVGVKRGAYKLPAVQTVA